MPPCKPGPPFESTCDLIHETDHEDAGPGLSRPGDIRLETIDTPGCGPGKLRLRVDAFAVCGTDLKTWHNGNPRIEPPRVMGMNSRGWSRRSAKA